MIQTCAYLYSSN